MLVAKNSPLLLVNILNFMLAKVHRWELIVFCIPSASSVHSVAAGNCRAPPLDSELPVGGRMHCRPH
jgi:hypothetical protein